ncbi:MFS transporter [Rhodoluna lacicola]|uniref:MFS transporter n=1 Tax=Rhodoluna lacicola TaxID=529884 RepID=UPI00222ED391|nr:MFS transporter [Rhodoluna lacicola]BDS51029.1 MFS transporter [Rhodoluna lacicola]
MIKLRNRWVGLVFISMAISLVVIDSTIVNTIFPDIIQSLAIRSSEVQWVQESYVLVLASMLLVWGSLADRFGRRLILLFGLGIFVAASFRAGFADDATTLIIARVIQGVGGAMILPSTLSLVNANFQGKDRGIAFAIWGSTIGAMVAIGPVIGGWLATNLSWSWAFLVNIPIGLFIILGLLVFVVESKAENTAKGIDFIGAFFSMVLFGFLVFALIEGRLYGWLFVNPLHREFQIGDFKWAKEGISIIPIALLVALIALAAFVLYERRRTQAGKPVILDLDLFKISSFRNGSLAALIVSLGEFGLVFAIPLWLQGVLALDAISAGIVLLWLAGGALLASVLGGVLSNRFLPVQSVRLGLALEAIGVLGIAIFSSNSVGWWSIAVWLLIYGVGVGLATAQLTNVIMVDVPLEQVGQASGTQSTTRQIGSALGIAVLGTILFTSSTSYVGHYVENQQSISEMNLVTRQTFASIPANYVTETSGVIIKDLDKFLMNSKVPKEIADEAKANSERGFLDAVKTTSYAAALFLGLGLVATVGLERKKPKKKSPAKKTSA